MGSYERAKPSSSTAETRDNIQTLDNQEIAEEIYSLEIGDRGTDLKRVESGCRWGIKFGMVGMEQVSVLIKSLVSLL